MRRPWRFDPVIALTALLRDGELDLLANFGEHADALGRDWPTDDLWICAAQRSDLRRVVFGRDACPPLTDAVAASCAIPGYFMPVEIDGDAYVDGGVCSPTNADVLRRRDIELAVIISPMSGRDLARFGPNDAMRRYAKGKLRREMRRLRDAEIPAVVLEPGPATAAVLGRDPMADDHLREIVTSAFLDTGEQLCSARAAPLDIISRRKLVA